MAGPANRILGQTFPPAAPQPGPLGGLLPPQTGTRLRKALDELGPPSQGPPTKGYFVERMPAVIRKQLGGKSTLADQCMDYWITRPRNVNPENGLAGKV